MNDIDALLDEVRNRPEIRALPENAARGAEAYLQAYGYIMMGNPAAWPWQQRAMAMEYILRIARLTRRELEAAEMARRLIKRLSEAETLPSSSDPHGALGKIKAAWKRLI